MINNSKNTKIIRVVSISIACIILICVCCFVVLNSMNIEIIREIDGNPTGYQLILTAEYTETSISGEHFRKGKIIKKYNISENDIFDEPMFGGVWRYNRGSSPIVKIIKLDDNYAQINVYKYNKLKEDVTTINLSYNKDLYIASGVFIADSRNYTYSIKIKKGE